MTAIRDLLQRPLDQKIVEVIQLDQINEEAVANEIREYVVTDRIRDKYEELLRAILEARSGSDEAVGVWVSGFFGSGKSSFAKNLGYVLANQTLLGTPAAELFKAQLEDPHGKVAALIDSVNRQLPTRVIMFDVQKDRSQSGHGGLSITPYVYRVLLRELGYAEDFDLAELEIDLEGQGRLADFERRFNERYAGDLEQRQWRRQGRKGAEVWNRVGAILHDMDPATYPTEESFARGLNEGRVNLTPRLLVSRTFELMQRREPGKAITFIIDEVGQYVAYSQERLEDLRAVVELFGVESRNRVKAGTIPGPAWFIVTSQERLDEVTSAIGTDQRVLLAKVRDRFKWEVDLSPADIRVVATRRVLSKTPAGSAQLQRLFAEHQGQLNMACRLERTTRQSELTATDFAHFYPYLPHYIELSIDIMSGIRLQPGAMRQLGGSNRTIISQVYQMLVNDRTHFADRPMGALVTLDQIYELIEAQVGSTKQKDIADIGDRFQGDGGWAARVAKALALLEFVRDLPRTAGNLAAVLVDTVGQPAPQKEVQDALARLEAAQFIRSTEEGYKLQTAQEKSWAEERRGYEADIRPKERDDLEREILGDLFSDSKLRTHRYQNKTFKIGLRVGGQRTGDDGQVDLTLLVADDAAARTHKHDEAIADSRQPANQNTLYWIMTLDPAIDSLVARLHASRRMISLYDQRRAQGQLPPSEAESLTAERTEAIRIGSRLKDKMEVALRAGGGIFRGVARDAAVLGRTTGEMFGRLFDWAIPDLYPKLEMGTRPLKGSEADELLRAANLQGLSQPVFYGGKDGLDLLVKEGSKYVPNKEAPVVKEVLDFLNQENKYGNKVTGKDLEAHFGGLGYGWDLDIVQLVLAVLLRAGAVEVTYEGRRFSSPQDPQSRTPITSIPAFRRASFAPRQAISLQTLTAAVRAFEDLTGEEVDVEETAIAAAFKRFAEGEMRQLLPVIATARAHRLAVAPLLEEYRQTLDGVLVAPSDDCVRTLAGEGNSLKAAHRRFQSIEGALTESNLTLLQRARDEIVQQIWPALSSQAEGAELAAPVRELTGLLNTPDLVEQLPSIKKIYHTVLAVYQRLYSDLHIRRRTAFALAVDEMRSRAGLLGIVDPRAQEVIAGGESGGTAVGVRQAVAAEAWDHALAPLLGRLCPPDGGAGDGAPDLSDSATLCRRCSAALGQMESDLAALPGLKAQVLERFTGLLPPPKDGQGHVVRVRLMDFFDTPLDSPQSVTGVVDGLRDHLLKLVAEGAQIVLE